MVYITGNKQNSKPTKDEVFLIDNKISISKTLYLRPIVAMRDHAQSGRLGRTGHSAPLPADQAFRDANALASVDLEIICAQVNKLTLLYNNSTRI